MSFTARPTSSPFPDNWGSRATLVEVNLGALRHNVEAIRARVGNSQIMGIVKANAYGHGLGRIARELLDCGVQQLGVAYVEEGIELRRNGIQAPILVLGGIIGDQVSDFIEHDLMITASSTYKLEQIEEAAQALGRRAKIHIKIDTGMERLGVHHYSAESLLEAVSRSRWCELCGVFSHFAASDSPDARFTHLQLERFLETLEWFSRRSLPMPLRHIANSGAILNHPETFLDMVRPGIALYGVYPDGRVLDSVPLRRVLSLKTRVVFFKVTKAGASVGYNQTWTAPHDTRIVTLPVGYGDGYRRSLSNKGQVLIGGKRFPIVGIVSMDQITVDIGPDGTAYNDDEVVLLGEQDGAEIAIEEIAAWMDTIPYEVLTGINTRVPRIYVQDKS
jgi:alanine racemase